MIFLIISTVRSLGGAGKLLVARQRGYAIDGLLASNNMGNRVGCMSESGRKSKARQSKALDMGCTGHCSK